ncbi:YbaB/EbfC family nucleoid-associated protein [Nocardia sp. CA-135398]|uniref:YbaB/EbfC family nucleoid-associated protein n=1 Tax=Nocardia sp. CA-135398 TaxID=3239977 RepID=UPI003D964489
MQLYPKNGDIDPITNQIDAVQRALMTDRSTASRYGVAVDVLADGTLQAVRIDESVTPFGAALGNLITELVHEALDQARGNVRERLAELSADPRIAAAVETLGLAAERPYPVSFEPTVRHEPSDDELTEEELIEQNQRRNQSYW